MDASILVACISGAAAIGAAAVSYSLTKRRERENEWRKLKLEHYQEYIAALSGIAGVRASSESQRRYSDAVNSLMLVAPEPVLEVLYKFQTEISIHNRTKSDNRHHELLSELIRAIRADVHPALSGNVGFMFKVYEAPPSELKT